MRLAGTEACRRKSCSCKLPHSSGIANTMGTVSTVIAPRGCVEDGEGPLDGGFLSPSAEAVGNYCGYCDGPVASTQPLAISVRALRIRNDQCYRKDVSLNRLQRRAPAHIRGDSASVLNVLWHPSSRNGSPLADVIPLRMSREKFAAMWRLTVWCCPTRFFGGGASGYLNSYPISLRIRLAAH